MSDDTGVYKTPTQGNFISVRTYNTHENARKDIKYSLHIFVDDEEEAGQIN